MIQKGGVFPEPKPPIKYWSQRVSMKVIVEHGLSKSNRQELKRWVQCTISDYSVCASNLDEYGNTALGRVANSGTPHISRLIISYLVHSKKKSCDQVHEYARVLEWYDSDSEDDSD